MYNATINTLIQKTAIYIFVNHFIQIRRAFNDVNSFIKS